MKGTGFLYFSFLITKGHFSQQIGLEYAKPSLLSLSRTLKNNINDQSKHTLT